MADVFVSYSRKNRDRVEAIGSGLAQRGYSLWWDQGLAASEDYAMRIESEIDAASCVVVAWSNSARQSLWVRAEANEALDAGKLVQVSLDKAKLPLPFTMLHWLDFSRWSGERQGSPWTDLETKVGAFVGGQGVMEAPNAVRGPALQGLGRTAWLGWAAILLAALIAGAAGMAATGGIQPAAFDGLALAALVLALLLLAMTAFLLLRISAASRR